jgi:hypothetical protein
MEYITTPWEHNVIYIKHVYIEPDRQILSSGLSQDQPQALSLLPSFLYIFCKTVEIKINDLNSLTSSKLMRKTASE